MGFTVMCYGPYIFTVKCYTARILLLTVIYEITVKCYNTFCTTPEHNEERSIPSIGIVSACCTPRCPCRQKYQMYLDKLVYPATWPKEKLGLML